MAEEKYLNQEGLSHFLDKLKELGMTSGGGANIEYASNEEIDQLKGSLTNGKLFNMYVGEDCDVTLTNVSGKTLDGAVTIKYFLTGGGDKDSIKGSMDSAEDYSGEEFNGSWPNGEQRSAYMKQYSAQEITVYVLYDGVLLYAGGRAGRYAEEEFFYDYTEDAKISVISKATRPDQTAELINVALEIATGVIEAYMANVWKPSGDEYQIVLGNGTRQSIGEFFKDEVALIFSALESADDALTDFFSNKSELIRSALGL